MNYLYQKCLLILVCLSSFSLMSHELDLFDYTGKNIHKDMQVETRKEEIPNFLLKPEILTQGHLQYYTFQGNKDDIREKDFLLETIQKLDLTNTFDGNGDRFDFSKVAYIIGNTTSESYTLDKITSKEFVECTNLKTEFIRRGEGNCLATKVKIPILSDIETEYQYCYTDELNNHFSVRPNLVTLGTLRKSNPEGLIDKGQLLSFYFDLPDKSGVLVVSYALTSLDFDTNSLGFANRLALKNCPDLLRENNFINRNIYTVRENRRLWQ